MTSAPSSRLAYIDWMRGLACVVMFQTHCYDAWLGGEARNSRFFMYSQLGGTLPAPLFLFLAGISVAFVVQRSLQKGKSPGEIGRSTIRRGAEILALGLLFRLQEFAISLGWAPWSDLFRVDILNTIGVSIMLMGAACWIVLSASRKSKAPLPLIAAATACGLAISMLSPLLWTIWRPRFLPWPLESYINGVHNLGTPQPWLFPIFPWAGFAFIGLALGFILFSPWGREREAAVALVAGAFGVGLIYFARWLDSLPLHLYPVYDFWHTSPAFFLIRVGLLLAILAAVYAWCRWGAGAWGFSPLAQLGQTSLLVYWVHIELVYGRFAILPHRTQSIQGASVGLLIIFLMMLALSLARARMKGRGAEVWAWLRRPARAN